MKAAYIISTVIYRLSMLVTILAIVLGIIFIPIAVDPMPAVKLLASVAIVAGILMMASKVLVKKTKQSILESMKSA